MTNGGSETLYEANAEPRSFGSRLWARVRPFRWLLVAAALPFLWFVLLYSHETVRFRIVVEIDTPSGVRVGSGVMVAGGECSSLPLPGPRCRGWSAGQAFPIDLGDGRRLVALVSNGTSPGGAGYLWGIWNFLASSAFDQFAQRSIGVLAPGTKLALGTHTPTLVIFERPEDLDSVRVVYMDGSIWAEDGSRSRAPIKHDRFERVLGAEYRLRDARLEIVAFAGWPGLWFFPPWTPAIDRGSDAQIASLFREATRRELDAARLGTRTWDLAGQNRPDGFVVKGGQLEQFWELDR